MPSHQIVTDEPRNAGTPIEFLLADLTPVDLAFVRNHFSAPRIDVATWKLTIGGLVDRQLQLGLDDIRDRAPVQLKTVLECAGNGRTNMDPVPEGTPWGYNAASVVEYRGTSLASLLDQAGPGGGASEVVFTGADRGTTAAGREESYARSLPLSIAMKPDVLLAWEMNGRPLTQDHGYPLRLVVPGWYGMASVKWMQRIEVVEKPFSGFFQDTHYLYRDEQGTRDGTPVRNIRVRSLIVSPEDGAEIRAGAVELMGVAWSGGVEVSRVELSFDEGIQWASAELERSQTRYGVQRWSYRWNLQAAGSHVIMVRATDARGEVQPTAQIWNRLGYGNNGVHSIRVRVG